MYINEDVKLIFDGHKTNDTDKKRVSEIQNVFTEKSITNNEKDLKARILEKVISQSIKIRLISNFYTDVLPLIRSITLVFKQNEPQVHKLHDRMVMALLSSLGCFMKHEVIANMSLKRL